MSIGFNEKFRGYLVNICFLVERTMVFNSASTMTYFPVFFYEKHNLIVFVKKTAFNLVHVFVFES